MRAGGASCWLLGASLILSLCWDICAECTTGRLHSGCLGPSSYSFILSCPQPSDILLVIGAQYRIANYAGVSCPLSHPIDSSCVAMDLTQSFAAQCNQRSGCHVLVDYVATHACYRSPGSGAGLAQGIHFAAVEYWCHNPGAMSSMSLCKPTSYLGSSAIIVSGAPSDNNGYIGGSVCFCEIQLTAAAKILVNVTLMQTTGRPSTNTCSQRVSVQDTQTHSSTDLCAQGRTAWFSTCETRAPMTLRLQYFTSDVSVLTKFAVSITASHLMPFEAQCGWQQNLPSTPVSQHPTNTGSLPFSSGRPVGSTQSTAQSGNNPTEQDISIIAGAAIGAVLAVVAVIAVVTLLCIWAKRRAAPDYVNERKRTRHINEPIASVYCEPVPNRTILVQRKPSSEPTAPYVNLSSDIPSEPTPDHHHQYENHTAPHEQPDPTQEEGATGLRVRELIRTYQQGLEPTLSGNNSTPEPPAISRVTISGSSMVHQPGHDYENMARSNSAFL